MAKLTFPLGQHQGILSFEEGDRKLSKVEIKTAIHILYYMGYDAHLGLNRNEITFGMRGLRTNDNGDDYRNILFNFVFLFSMFEINFPNLDYAKTYLRHNFMFLNKGTDNKEQEMVLHNGSLHLVLTSGIMVSGESFNFTMLNYYIDNFNAGNKILPLISKDIIELFVIKIKLDVVAGEPLNDEFANTNFNETSEDDLPF